MRPMPTHELRPPLPDDTAMSTTPENPIGMHLCATPDEIVRIYSTSGTTGTPSYIPLTADDVYLVDGPLDLGASVAESRRGPGHGVAWFARVVEGSSMRDSEGRHEDEVAKTQPTKHQTTPSYQRSFLRSVA